MEAPKNAHRRPRPRRLIGFALCLLGAAFAFRVLDIPVGVRPYQPAGRANVASLLARHNVLSPGVLQVQLTAARFFEPDRSLATVTREVRNERGSWSTPCVLTIWDSRRWIPRFRIPGVRAVYGVLPDGQILVQREDGTLVALDSRTSRVGWSIRNVMSGRDSTALVSPDRSLLAFVRSAPRTPSLEIWSTPNHTRVSTLGIASGVFGISSDGMRVGGFETGRSSVFWVRGIHTGSEFLLPEWWDRKVASAALLSPSEELLAGYHEGTLARWGIPRETRLAAPVEALLDLPVLQRFSPRRWRLRWSTRLGAGSIRDIRVTPTGDLAAVTLPGELVLADVRSGTVVQHIPTSTPGSTPTFTEDGSTLVIAEGDSLRVFRRSNQPVATGR